VAAIRDTGVVTFLITLLYCAAVLCAVMLWRTSLRWQRIGVRPVLSCAEVADAEPGTFVTVAGRTASGPTAVAAMSGWTCVWWEVIRVRTRVVSSNYEETTVLVDQVWGDPGLYGDRGELVRIEPDLGKRRLLAGRPPLMKEFGIDRDGGSDYATASHDRLHERIVPPDTPVVVTGVVRLIDGDPEARQLCRGGWVDGSAHAGLDELPGRYTRFNRWMVALVLVFLAFAVPLSVTS
jgi:hypothetical protein